MQCKCELPGAVPSSSTKFDLLLLSDCRHYSVPESNVPLGITTPYSVLEALRSCRSGTPYRSLAARPGEYYIFLEHNLSLVRLRQAGGDRGYRTGSPSCSSLKGTVPYIMTVKNISSTLEEGSLLLSSAQILSVLRLEEPAMLVPSPQIPSWRPCRRQIRTFRFVRPRRFQEIHSTVLQYCVVAGVRTAEVRSSRCKDMP